MGTIFTASKLKLMAAGGGVGYVLEMIAQAQEIKGATGAALGALLLLGYRLDARVTKIEARLENQPS